MRLIFVRHGDPNYEIDSLTDKGKVEAELLSKKLSKMKPDYVYCSPLGRAKATASYTLKKINKTSIEHEWLREFQGECVKPDSNGLSDICWDWLPRDWTNEPLFFDKDKWFEVPAIRNSNVKSEYDFVTHGLDDLLALHGYKRNKNLYEAIKANDDTLVFFCHLGVMAVMVSYLTGISPFVMLHAFAPAPSSVTTVVTEERIKGEAMFRVLSYGDQSHLYKYDEEPAFACRFCECFDFLDQRH